MNKEEKISTLKAQSVYPTTAHGTSLTFQQYLIGNLARNPAIVNSAADISARRIAIKIKQVADYLIEEMAKDYD